MVIEEEGFSMLRTLSCVTDSVSLMVSMPSSELQSIEAKGGMNETKHFLVLLFRAETETGAMSVQRWVGRKKTGLWGGGFLSVRVQ